MLPRRRRGAAPRRPRRTAPGGRRSPARRPRGWCLPRRRVPRSPVATRRPGADQRGAVELGLPAGVEVLRDPDHRLSARAEVDHLVRRVEHLQRRRAPDHRDHTGALWPQHGAHLEAVAGTPCEHVVAGSESERPVAHRRCQRPAVPHGAQGSVDPCVVGSAVDDERGPEPARGAGVAVEVGMVDPVLQPRDHQLADPQRLDELGIGVGPGAGTVNSVPCNGGNVPHPEHRLAGGRAVAPPRPSSAAWRRPGYRARTPPRRSPAGRRRG